jgi:hypothetical protein
MDVVITLFMAAAMAHGKRLRRQGSASVQIRQANRWWGNMQQLRPSFAAWPVAAALLLLPVAAAAQISGEDWKHLKVAPGAPVSTRPQPPKAGQKRCISVNTVAGAQLFGDRAVELTMKGGQRYRMFLAEECPALSFYQGFYYKPSKDGQLCAGKDVIGARSGGECGIASILPVRPVGKASGKAKARPRKRRR